jgi:tRNA 2-(methylsulfanyl)-N6-isopentenyladenosine37 hydroxylase
MLSLHSKSPERWLDQVRDHLDELLIDHAHCEKKAAGTAMNIIFYYVENEELCREMTAIVQEELEHFHMVRDLLQRRGIRFRRLKPSNYGSQLHELIRKQEPQRAVDRLLVSGLIEARSCERFGLLRDRLDDRELAGFYGSLFESEARHHSTYVRLARQFASGDEEVDRRLNELAAEEARIIAAGDPLPRMHS